MNLLAFDLGTKSGWASLNGELVQCGLINTQPTRFESPALRFIKFERAVSALLEVVKPAHVFFERVHRHMGVVAAHVYAGYMTKLMTACHEHGEIPFEGLSVQAIKKHACGKGSAPKEVMVALAKRKWPDHEILTDDVADAMWILDLGRTMMK